MRERGRERKVEKGEKGDKREGIGEKGEEERGWGEGERGSGEGRREEERGRNMFKNVVCTQIIMEDKNRKFGLF